MKRSFCALGLVLILLAGSCVWSHPAGANNMYQLIPASLTRELYNDDPDWLDDFLDDEESRCLASICAFLDWYDFDDEADCLMNYTYIGRDREENRLWFCFGGRQTSCILVYAPDLDPDFFLKMSIYLSASWMSTFLDNNCEPYFRNDGAVMMEMLLKLQDQSK